MIADPAVSIILPTFNRADVIWRAVDSIRRQTFENWELIIIDDGSTDDTVAQLKRLDDDRLRIVTQVNSGTYIARNLGLQLARGRYITFMDSDDEWLPHFLALTIGYLTSHPDAQWVTTEWQEDHGADKPFLVHDRHDISHIYLKFARSIGSKGLDLPPGETDGYLRVYQTRETVGAWGQEVLDRLGLDTASVYSGQIFESMRWGYLNWLPVTVMTRHAMETVGLFTTHTRSAADYRFLCLLARHFPCHMIAIASAVKYEKAVGSKALACGHLATGANAYRFELNKLSFFDELFWQPRRSDAELSLLRKHYCINAGHRALMAGHRSEAIDLLGQATALRRGLWRAAPMWLLALVLPGRLCGLTYRSVLRLQEIGSRLAQGQISPRVLLGKLLHKVQAQFHVKAARDPA
jgi:glycosyltransferase involved in cell wall biosynthesis